MALGVASVAVTDGATAATVSQSGNQVTVTAASGETNYILVGILNGGLIVRDGLLPLTVGSGCTAQAFNQARCTVTNSLLVRVDLSDGDDKFDKIAGPASLRVEVLGGPGRDTFGGAVDSTVTTVLDGGPGDDLFRARPGSDTFIGGDGRDELFRSAVDPAVSVTMNGVADDGAPGEGDNVGADIEYLHGTEGNDTFLGAAGNEEFNALGGNDVIDGAGGNDVLRGRGGDDTLVGGDGDDLLEGDAGSDRLTGGPGNDSMLGQGGGADMLFARDGAADAAISCGGDSPPNGVAVIDAPIDYAGVQKAVNAGEVCKSVDEQWVGAAFLAFADFKLRLKGARVRLKTRCRAVAGARCRGTLRLARGRRTLARARFSIAADQVRTVGLRVTRAGRRRLRARQKTKADLRVHVRGTEPRVIPVTIRR